MALSFVYLLLINTSIYMKYFSTPSIILVLFCCLIGFAGKAQQVVDKPSFWQNVQYGGNVGVNLGRNFTSIFVAPQAVYRVNNTLALGTGLNYSYTERDLNQSDDFKSVMAGGSLISIVNPIDYLQMSADFEYVNVNRNFADSRFDDNYWVPALFLGAGYRQGNFVLGARYDVLHSSRRSVYQNGIQPFVRVLF